MTDTPFTRLAEDAAVALKDDAELYLDVTQELTAHLEDTAEKLKRQGHEEAESIALAVQAFGSPLDVAHDLQEANRGRLKLRALIRLGLRTVLIPLALVLAVWIVGDTWRLALGIEYSMPFVNTISNDPPYHLQHSDARTKKAFRFLMDGGTPKGPVPSFASEGARKDRSIWERQPANKVYTANYMVGLSSTLDQIKRQDLPVFERECRLAMRVDPNNALYHFMLASAYLKLGATLLRPDHTSSTMEIRLLIRDRALLDRAMAELRTAAAKPYCRSYAADLYRERMSYLAPTHRYAEAYTNRLCSIYTPFVSTSLFPTLMRALPIYSRLLLREEKRKEAEATLDAWRPLLAHWTEASETAIQALLLPASVELSGDEVAKQYDLLSRHADADAVRRLRQQVLAYQAERNRMPVPEAFKAHASTDAAFWIPAIPGMKVTLADLAPGRLLQYTYTQENLLAVLLGVLLFFLAQAAIASWLWYHGLKTAQSAPLLLLPPWLVLLRIVLLGILLPLVLYTIYLQVPALSGRNLGLASHAIHARLLVECSLILASFASLPMLLARRYIRRRCDDLGVAVPPARKGLPPLFILLLVALGVAGVYYVLKNLLGNYDFLCYRPLLFKIPEWAFESWLALSLALIYERVKKDKLVHALYHGTLARSLVPIYALAILLIGGITYPWLVQREKALMRQETLYLPDNPITTTVEARFVDESRAFLHRVLGR